MVAVSHNTIHCTVWKPKLDAIVSALTRSLYVRSRLTAVSSSLIKQGDIMKNKDWTIATSAIIVLLCLMSLMDDGYDVKVAANQDLIEAQTAARLELADRKIERDYLIVKAGNMTEQRTAK